MMMMFFFRPEKKLYSKPVYIDSVFLVTEKSYQKQILTDRNQQQQNRPILVV